MCSAPNFNCHILDVTDYTFFDLKFFAAKRGEKLRVAHLVNEMRANAVDGGLWDSRPLF